MQPHKITSVEFTHWMDTATRSCRIYGEISHSVHFNHSASVGSRRGRGTGAGRHRSFLFPLLPLCLCDLRLLEQIEFCDGRPKDSQPGPTIHRHRFLLPCMGRAGTELGTGCSCCGHYCAETTGGELKPAPTSSATPYPSCRMTPP